MKAEKSEIFFFVVIVVSFRYQALSGASLERKKIGIASIRRLTTSAKKKTR